MGSFKEKWLPFIKLTLFLALVIGVTQYSLTQQDENQQDAVREKKFLHNHVEKVSDNLSRRLNLTADQEKDVTNILNGLRDDVLEADEEIQDILDDGQKMRYRELKQRFLDRSPEKKRQSPRGGR